MGFGQQTRGKGVNRKTLQPAVPDKSTVGMFFIKYEPNELRKMSSNVIISGGGVGL